MKKALNFDLDTKKYEKLTNKKSPTAYGEIKKFLKKYNFMHRQGSGYISKNSLRDDKVFAIMQIMSYQLYWLRYAVKEIDVTNIGKQHSLKEAINTASIQENYLKLIEI